MTWIGTKHVLKKIWEWVKHYWYVPVLLVYTVVLLVVTRRKPEAALAVLAASKESYKKQIAVLNQTHEKELEKREEITRKYNEIIEEAEKGHAVSLRKLDDHKKQRIKNLVERHHEDPEQLTQLLKLTFGIFYEEG